MINTNINKYIIFISLTIFLVIIVVVNNSQEKFETDLKNELLSVGSQLKGTNLGYEKANDDQIFINYIENIMENKKCQFEDRENNEQCLGYDDDSYICKVYDDLNANEKDTYIEIKRLKQLIKLHGIKNILDKINTLDD